MAADKSGEKSTGVCEKLFNAVTVSPAFRKIRRVSLHPHSSTPTNKSSQNPKIPTPKAAITLSKPSPLQQPSSGAVIPNQSGTTVLESPAKIPKNGAGTSQGVKNGKNQEPAPPARAVIEIHGGDEKPKDKKHGEENTNDKFSDYINRVKHRMRIPSNVGAVKNVVGRVDSLNEKVTNYINRAKGKIRTTTNVGAGEIESSK